MLFKKDSTFLASFKVRKLVSRKNLLKPKMFQALNYKKKQACITQNELTLTFLKRFQIKNISYQMQAKVSKENKNL